MKKIIFLIFIFSLIFSASESMAENALEYNLRIKNHKFYPEKIEVPAHKKIKIIFENQDSTMEEFHSDDLKREKVVAGGKKGIILIGPLKPGNYKFMGEFHAKTAQGVIIAK